MNRQQMTRLSRRVAHALRHQPWLYELELDADGWTPVAALLAALGETDRAWRGLTEADLQTMIATTDKQRYEIQGGRIRAFYGHSLPGRLARRAEAPPAALYHGTAPAAVPAILAQGLRPMRRQYVHLSADLVTATLVGRRKAPKPVILVVDAAAAHAAGVGFYRGNQMVWLADSVPARFIEPA